MIRYLKIVIFFIIFASSDAYAQCRRNNDCLNGWVCTGAISGSSRPVGICKPNIVLVQICNAQRIITGRFAFVVLLIAIMALAITFMMGKIEWSAIVATLIGTAFVFGSFQFVNLIIGGRGNPCANIGLK